MRHTCLTTLGLLLVTACADYQFTVNEKVVYTPAPLFAEYDIPDTALRECVKQHVRDSSITTAIQLTELNCSHAGVTSLQGLDTFTGLTRLKLSSNSIADLAPLAALSRLHELHLDGNRLRSLMSLRGLTDLSYLSVQGNQALSCGEVRHFADLPNLTLEPPQHCAA